MVVYCEYNFYIIIIINVILDCGCMIWLYMVVFDRFFCVKSK